MRRLLPAVAVSCVLLLMAMVAGCGVSNNSGRTNSPSLPAASFSKFLYGVVGFEPSGNGPEAGAIDSSTGAITPVPGTPFDAGLGQSNILQVLADPQGRFIYTLHQQASSFGDPIGLSGIAAQKVDPQTGALLTSPSPIIFTPGQNHTTPLAIDGLGRFIFQGIATGFEVYAIDQNSGALTKTLNAMAATPLGSDLISSPDGNFLFDAGNGSIESLSIDPQSGQLALVSGTPIASGGSAGPLAIEADGRFLYAAHASEGTVSVFAVASGGGLTSVGTFQTPTGAQWLALTPNGQFLYGIFGTDTALVQGFQVNPTSGQFMNIAGFVPISATAIAVDGSGKFAYLSEQSNNGSFSLGTFNIDPASGALIRISSAIQPVTDNQNNFVVIP